MEPIIGIGTVLEVDGNEYTVTRIYGVHHTDSIGDSVTLPTVVMKHKGGSLLSIDGRELESLI